MPHIEEPLAPIVQARGQQQRPIRVASFFSGTCSEDRVLGLSNCSHQLCFTCDMKSHSFRYIELNSTTQACHFMCIKELAESIQTTGRAFGHCARHNKICEVPADVAPDIITAGFECKAFSQARTGRRKDGTASHPTALLWEPLLVLFAFLRATALLIENVWGMAMAERSGPPPNGDPVSPLEKMIQAIESRFPTYFHKVYVCDGNTFLCMKRRRVYVTMVERAAQSPELEAALSSIVKER